MSDYIIEPLDTDVESIFQDFVDYVRSYYPDWNPSEAQLDVIIARFYAQQTATVADMASRVQRSIYRYMGASLLNIPPIEGAAAVATVSFHVMDDLAHTMEVGTQLGLTDANGDLHMFQTTVDMVSPANAVEWPSVEAQAVDLGADANNLSGAVQLMELFDWIDDAQVVGTSSGGADAEEDDVYIQRLTDNMQIPRRPTIADDVVVMARNVPGVWRAAAIDNYRSTGAGTYATDMEDSIALSAIDENGIEISGAIRNQLVAYIQSNLRQNFILNWVSPVYHTINITYKAHGYQVPGYDTAAIKSEIDASFARLLDPAISGQKTAEQPISRNWTPVRVIRFLDLTTVVENNRQVDYTETLTFNIDGGTDDKNDKPLTGVFPLTRPGVFTGTVVVP
jgi:hypothetical protein